MNLNNKKILLIRNDNIGDLICTTPSIEALRKKYQNARIDIVVNSYNYCAIYKNPFIDKIYVYTKPKHKKSLKEKLSAIIGKTRILIDIFSEKYDAVVVLRAGYSKSTELFAKISRAPIKIGVKNPKGSDVFTHGIQLLDNRHEALFCYDALGLFSIKPSEEKTLITPKNELKDMFKNLRGKTLLHISSRKNDNKIDEAKWLEICATLNLSDFYINSAPEDSELCESIASKSGAKIVKTKNFDELVALVANAAILITLDGGALHIGPALGIKTIGILGSTNFERWYPWGAKEFCIKSRDGKAQNIDTKEIAEIYEKAVHS